MFFLRKRQERTNIYSPTSWFPEIGGYTAFWDWNQTSYLHSQSESFKINIVPEGKLCQHKNTSLRNSRENHHVCFLKHQLSWRCFEQCIDSNISAKEFGTAVTLVVKRCLILFGFFKSNLFGLCPVSDKATTPQNFPRSAARKPKMMWFHQRTYLGNRKREQGILQPFPFMPTSKVPGSISNATLVFGVCPSTGISFSWEFQEIVVSSQRLIVSYWLMLYCIHAKCRLCLKGRFSKSGLPKADKAEAEGCQDPRQLVLLLPWENINFRCY